MNRELSIGIAFIALAWAVAGCAGGSSGSANLPHGNLGVTQGGAQDIAEFRSVVSAGGIPSPQMLDPVGFFAEHAFDLPPADCGKDICVHPSLAVAPRFDHSNWTMAFIALNTPIDPSTFARPAMHTVFVIESSDALTNDVETGLLDGIAQFGAASHAEDKVSVVVYRELATREALGVSASWSGLNEALTTALADHGENRPALYDGLRGGLDAIDDLTDFDGSSRIVLVTSGRALAGITDPDRIVALASSMAERGIAIDVVGFGAHYQAALPDAIGELGAGSHAFADVPNAFEEILRGEAQTTVFPLATDFELRVIPAPGYAVGRVYGARRAIGSSTEVTLISPALFIGQRDGATDVAGGRRGGGGGFFVELIADPSSGIAAGQPAFRVEATWTSSAGASESSSNAVMNALAPGQNPTALWPSFSDETHRKPYMMLNMYLALRAFTELEDSGDCGGAKGISDMMQPSVEGWQARDDDPDIAADYDLLLHLRTNADHLCAATPPVQRHDFGGGCMLL